ncbi:MAG: protein-L-isoaspartate(D-aspartate) O-methyltransferase [Parvibaculaceae bacterium]|jgi:protein-L-isoaspartate(D-aspartate) O-methyltransferase|tara:strand:+ start:129 stop:803 length:675 start_codon:yes stop_codon:yes gene_type:complete
MSEAEMSLDEDGETNKISLIMELRKQGIRANDVLSAIERIPRDEFISTSFKAKAYDNHPLPIECGQTISQPFVVAYMTEQLRVGDRMKVLEIGTGSGYQSAILSLLCRRVYTIERYRTLMRDAVNRLEGIRIHNVTAMVGDGAKGWPEQAPFDRIIVTAAAGAIPLNLLEQLKVGGIMVVPVDNPQRRGEQKLLRLTRTDTGFEQEDLLDVRFVPLVEGVAREG